MLLFLRLITAISLLSVGVINTMLAYFLVSFLSITFSEVVPLWAIASHVHDGLSLQQVQVGYLMSLAGALLVIYTLFIYPKMANALGSVWGFKAGQWVAVFFVLMTPMLNYLPSNSRATFPLLVLIFACGKASTALCFSSIALVLNQCVSKEKRGSLNGLNMSVGSLSKTIGPSIGTYMFAWSINNGLSFPFDFRFIFLVMSLCGTVSALVPLPSQGNMLSASELNHYDIEMVAGDDEQFSHGNGIRNGNHHNDFSYQKVNQADTEYNKPEL